MTDVNQLLRDVDEVFDTFVRAGWGPDDCSCNECRGCFAWSVAVRLAEFTKGLPKPEPKRIIVIGNVVDNLSFGKYCVLNQEQADKANKEDHKFVCEKAHEDGSFAYLCDNKYCRCCQ